ncbi:GyrI-like domain-containing protein [Tenacibaculum amylolyticum]|uniref:GyrI-like domain-containing protein n=1 Tax=Tenacibaculum amylolyticum TaxID=104269 RepID=UPI003894C709
MKTTRMNTFNVIGIKVRTTNKDMQAAKDIPALWEEFMSKNLREKIPNKHNNDVYAIYTNYESDYTGAYDMIIGCKVTSLNDIPTDMTGVVIPECTYQEFIAKGKLNDNIVYNKWMEIWQTNLNREYKADFEIYSENVVPTINTEVPIYISIQ